MSVYQLQQKEIGFVRYIRLLAECGGSVIAARDKANEEYGQDHEVSRIAKSAVGAQTTADGLTQLAPYGAGFLEFATRRAIVGKLPNLRRSPLEVAISAATSHASAGWVGEGAAITVSPLAFESLTLAPLKVASLTVISDALARLSTPEAEALIRTDLAKAVATQLDETFASNSAATSTAPAGVAHGAPTVASSGNIESDTSRAVNLFDGDLDQAVWIMSPALAVSLSGADHPDLTARGGTFKGLPTITTTAMDDTSAGSRILLLDPTRVAYGDGGLVVDVSRQGTVQMVDSSSQDASIGLGATQVSLFQANAVAIKAVQFVNWKTSNGACVQITGVNW